MADLPNAPDQANAPPGGAATDAARTVLIIDGAYAHIGSRRLEGGRIDYVKLRSVLEDFVGSRLRECWFFDQEPIAQRSAHQSLSAQYTALKLAPPHGPQFQLKLYAMKKYQCHCRRCGHQFHQLVQKGVDNGIATKILSLAYENICDRFILFAGDGDFYDSLNQIKNVLRKDLWVVGYRDTVSADLQQLASHVIWMNDLWPSIKFPTAPGGTVPNDAEEEEEEVSEEDHAPRRPPKKRSRDRQVQVTSQPPPLTSSENKNRRDFDRAWQQRGGTQPPGASSGAPSTQQGGSYHQSAATGVADNVSPRQRNGVHHGAVTAEGAPMHARGFQQHSYGANSGGSAPSSPGRSRGGYHQHRGARDMPLHAMNGAPPRPRGGNRHPAGDLGGNMSLNPANGAATTARYNDSEDDDRIASRGGRRYQRGKRQRNGELRSKRDQLERDVRPLRRPGVLGAAPGGPSESNKGGDREADASNPVPNAPVSFALSDISTSGDEDEKYVMPPVAKMAKITVIDLASDSETE